MTMFTIAIVHKVQIKTRESTPDLKDCQKLTRVIQVTPQQWEGGDCINGGHTSCLSEGKLPVSYKFKNLHLLDPHHF